VISLYKNGIYGMLRRRGVLSLVEGV